jgi:hypothetical protein
VRSIWFWIIIVFVIGIGVLLNPWWQQDWRSADRSSAGIAPNPRENKQAIVQIYMARTFGWRGIFAVHTWIAIKEKNAAHYKVYQVIGWRKYRDQSVLSVMDDIPDRKWFNHKPKVILTLQGEQAEHAIAQIRQAVNHFSASNNYHLWPGPNSNSFVAYVVRQSPALATVLPGLAIGKDYLPWGQFLVKAPSGTGYTLSLLGILGLTFAKQEGLEVNLLGLVFAFNVYPPRLSLPLIGSLLGN